jgi:signal transduction histidine kinase
MSKDGTPGHGGRLGDAQLVGGPGTHPRVSHPISSRLRILLRPIATAFTFCTSPPVTRAVKVTVLLLILQAILVLGLWWLSEEWLSPKMPTSIDRIADLYAAGAGRFMVGTDQKALDLLVKQGAAWPDIAYIGVEDAVGTVLAHTDATRVGRVWNEVMTTGVRSVAGVPLREIAVLILNPDQRTGPPVGRIRLGYRTIDDGTIGMSALGQGSVVPFLVITVVATIPLGWLTIVLARPSGRHSSAAGSPLEALAQVAWATQGESVTEVRRLKVALADRDAQVALLTEAVEHAARSRSVDPSHHRAILSITRAVRASLSNILGFSKLLLRELDGQLTDTQTADVRNIQRAGAELLSFVTALSELSRAEAGQILIQPETMDAKTLLTELAAEYGSAHSLDIKVECPAELPMVRTDRAHLGQILHALILPASSPSGGHGEVVLSARSNGETVDIAVAHPGRVTSDDDLATMFDPYASKEPSTGRVSLTLARSLAILDGGGLAVESQSGNGLVFTLKVPTELATTARPIGDG